MSFHCWILHWSWILHLNVPQFAYLYYLLKDILVASICAIFLDFIQCLLELAQLESIILNDFLAWAPKVKVKVTQLCLTLCDRMDCSLPGSSVHGILQARILEWLPLPSPEDLPDPGIEPRSLSLQADSLLSKPPEKPHAYL